MQKIQKSNNLGFKVPPFPYQEKEE